MDTLSLVFLTGITLLTVLVMTSASHNKICLDRYCSDEKPYCTPVGCVFDCPKGTFYNDSDCVIHCGDMFIDNRTCVNLCPNTSHLVQEQIVVQGLQFYKYKICKNVCPPHMFELNDKCLYTCPDNKRYVHRRKCIAECPNTSPYHMNIFSNNRVVAIECISSCSSGTPFLKSGYCVSVCNKTEVVFEGKCSQRCPGDLNHLNLQSCIAVGKCKNEWPEQVYCSSTCPENYYSFNKTCKSKCPVETNKIFNGKCISACPRSHPYHRMLWWKSVSEKLYSCTDKCPVKTNVTTLECVTYCDKGAVTFNDKCLEKCPKNTYLLSKTNDEKICVEVCPTFAYKGKCVDTCPKFFINKTCVDSCPSFYKTLYKKSCEVSCPVSTCLTMDGVNCTENCSFNVETGKLVYVCPEHFPYKRKNSSGSFCVAHCENHEVLDEDRCINITECNRPVLSQGQCSDECPLGYLYMSYDYTKEINKTDANFEGNIYKFTDDNLRDDPCKLVQYVYLDVILYGFLSLFYGVFYYFSVSTKRVTCLLHLLKGLPHLNILLFCLFMSIFCSSFPTVFLSYRRVVS